MHVLYEMMIAVMKTAVAERIEDIQSRAPEIVNAAGHAERCGEPTTGCANVLRSTRTGDNTVHSRWTTEEFLGIAEKFSG